MTRGIVWAPKASKDFLAAIDWIEADHPINAHRVAERVDSLAAMATGRPGRVAGTYESYVPRTSLIIAFQLTDKSILQILRIIHAKRNWQSDQWPS